MKISLIHSYSDFNKGDLGIIKGTIASLKNADKNCQINCISSFTYDDPFFQTHHEDLKKHVDFVHPGIIGRLFTRRQNIISKTLKLSLETIKMIFIYVLPIRIIQLLILNKYEKQTLNTLGTSDVIISKGGSFICNSPGLIGMMRLYREMTIMILSFKMGKPVYIFGQSIGPVHGYLSTKLLNYVLLKSTRVIVRESNCIKNYPNIKFPANTDIGYDLAFNLILPNFEKSTLNDTSTIGFTVKRFTNKTIDKKYTKILIDVINHILETTNKKIIIVPHVTIDDDLNKALEIYKGVSDINKSKLTILSDDYSIPDLLNIYRKFDLLIGTRLHSTIFAMVTGTRVINIAYHGTKASGVFDRFDMTEWVIEGENLTYDNLIDKIEKTLNNNEYTTKIKDAVQKAKSTNEIFAKKMLSIITNE